VAVAQALERASLEPPVADVAIHPQRALVARAGLAVLAHLVVDQAEAVPGVGLPKAVVEVAQQRDGLLAVRPRPLVLAEMGVVPADAVERRRLAGPVPGGPEEGQRPLCVGDRVTALAALPG
jgi:hypothetical protein